jgi:hypothetical protein
MWLEVVPFQAVARWHHIVSTIVGRTSWLLVVVVAGLSLRSPDFAWAALLLNWIVMGRRMYEKFVCQRLVCLLSSPKIGVDAPTHEDA